MTRVTKSVLLSGNKSLASTVSMAVACMYMSTSMAAVKNDDAIAD